MSRRKWGQLGEEFLAQRQDRCVRCWTLVSLLLGSQIFEPQGCRSLFSLQCLGQEESEFWNNGIHIMGNASPAFFPLLPKHGVCCLVILGCK